MKDFKTLELVEELKEREGVQVHLAEPHKDIDIAVNGPAIVLVVTD
ncbi:MAG: BC1881 family protein [Lachnotalea sp.]